MAIMDMFSKLTSPAAPTAAPAPTPTTPGNIPPATSATGQTSPGTAPNGVVPPAAPETPPTPEGMDVFSKLWEPSAAKPEDAPAFANIDPQKLMDAAGKTDFSKVVSQDMMQKIQGGGADAMQAMMEAMNKMSQTVYAQSAFAATKMITQALEQSEAKQAAHLPNKIKSQQVSESLRAENSALSHPAAQPILNAIEIQMANKFPNASAAELTSLAKDYLANFAAAVTPKKTEEATKVPKSEDWEAFLN